MSLKRRPAEFKLVRITKQQLKQIIKEELAKILAESSRPGESHDADYEDGSHGLDPKYPGNMDYMSGWETGEEDAQYDVERAKRGESVVDEGYYSSGREGAYGDPSHEPSMDWEDRRNAGWRDGIRGKDADPRYEDNSLYKEYYNRGKKEFLEGEGKNYE